MTLEELKQIKKERDLTKEDIFNFYGVRNEDGFDIAFEQKLVLNVQDHFISTNFGVIYAASLPGKEYSPLREKFIFYGVALRGLYNFPIEEFNLLVDAFGFFNFIFKLEKLLATREEINYFKSLYELYLQRTQNLGVYIDDAMNKLNNLINEKIAQLDPSKIDQLVGEFTKGISKLK